MRVASNKLKDIIDFFYSELVGTYERPEIEVLINIAVHHYLVFSKTEVLKKGKENLNQSDLIKLYDCCKDLKKNIPNQYILAEAWFYHLKFHVNRNVTYTQTRNRRTSRPNSERKQTCDFHFRYWLRKWMHSNRP